MRFSISELRFSAQMVGLPIVRLEKRRALLHHIMKVELLHVSLSLVQDISNHRVPSEEREPSEFFPSAERSLEGGWCKMAETLLFSSGSRVPGRFHQLQLRHRAGETLHFISEL